MRSVLAILMFATMIQVAHADDDDGEPVGPMKCVLTDVNGTTQCR